MYIQYTRCCFVNLLTFLVVHLTAAFTVSLELQGNCSDQLTLICRHSDSGAAPLWIHNGTVESGEVLVTAFPGASYAVQNPAVHRATITGVDNVQAVDGLIIQCAYNYLGNLTKSNGVKFSFIPSGQSYKENDEMCQSL